MNRDVADYVVGELKQFRRNKAILEGLMIENDISIPAQLLSDMPRSITNKFSSATENMALSNRLYGLDTEVKRFENWLKGITDEQRFVVERFYMDNQTYIAISNNWSVEKEGMIFSEITWKNRRKSGLRKICEIFEKCLK